MSFDPKKPVEYVDLDGTVRPARILTTDRKSETWPIVALYDNGDEEMQVSTRPDGYTRAGSGVNGPRLRNKPVEHSGFINVYPDASNLASGRKGMAIFDSAEDARRFAKDGALATAVPVKWIEAA